MAPKKALPPPSPEPEEEEETTDDEEEEEEEETTDEEDEESDEESDFSEDEETTPLQLSEVNETGSPKVSDFASSKSISQTKRSFDDGKESRNGKKVKTDEGEQKKVKGSAFSATGGDGMAFYQDKDGTDPYTNRDTLDAFHELIKRKLRADISKNQLFEKVRSLKQNYFAIVEKENNGEKHVFSRPHQSKIFDLSKKIWGNENGKKDDQIGRPTGNWKESDKHDSNMNGISDEEEDFGSKYPFLSQSLYLEGLSSIPPDVLRYMERNLAVLGHVRARELDEKWKKIRREEAEILLKKLTLMRKMVQLVLEADKEAGN